MVVWNSTQPLPGQNISSGQGTILNNFQFLGESAGNSANGYYKLPNGLILNWGNISLVNTTAGTIVTFAQAYVGVPYSIVLQLIKNTSTEVGGSTRTAYVSDSPAVSNTGFRAKLVSSDS